MGGGSEVAGRAVVVVKGGWEEWEISTEVAISMVFLCAQGEKLAVQWTGFILGALKGRPRGPAGVRRTPLGPHFRQLHDI